MSFVLLSVRSCARLCGEGVAALRAPPGTAKAPLQRNPLRRLLARSLLGLTLASAPFAVTPGAWEDPGPAALYAGELLVRRQTPHRWAVDAVGVAHLVAASRALAAHEVAAVAHLEVSLDGLRLIGIDAENFGRLVPDQPTWEARSGLRVADLLIESLMLDGSLNGQVPVEQTAQEPSERSALVGGTAPAAFGPPGLRSEGEPSLPPPDRPASWTESAVA